MASGFSVYRFDFSGCGESEGDYQKTSLSKQRDELSLILEFVKSKGFESESIGILAQSFGTCITISLKPEVGAVIFTGAIADPKKVLSTFFGNNYNQNGISSIKRSNGHATSIEAPFWKDLETHNLAQNIEKLQSPILFMRGSEDKLISRFGVELLYNLTKGLKKLTIIEDAGHDLKPKWDEVADEALIWFKEFL